MNPNGSEAMDAFAMNNGTSSQNHTPDFSQFQVDPSFLNSTAQTQKQRQGQQPVMQQNPISQWAHANQSMPPLSFLAQQPWTNPLPQAQQIQNAMLQMAPFNVPLLSQQIIQEAVAMSTPVDATDEPILLTALLNAKKTGRNFKEALNSLHGNKGHSASLWKDYYLEHKDRVDGWIDMCVKKEIGVPLPALKQATTQIPVATVKMPSPASFKRESSPTLSPKLSRPTKPVPSSRLVAKSAQKPATHVNIEGRRRSTMNSLSVPEPVFGEKLPAPNASIKVPAPPSRSPSPPAIIISQGRGNKFTKEDREFFIKFLGWRLKQQPSLNRQDLCDRLAVKAPHHSAGSWYAFWSNNHDLPDKILAAARGERGGSKEFTDNEEEPIPRRRPNYKDDTTSEDDNEESQGEDEESDDDESDTGPVRHYSEVDMGGTGGPFNEADMYITAKYIASTPDWEGLRNKDRWDPFHEKHPQRSAKSWTEHYRRYEKDLLELAKRIKLENQQSSITTQCARPSKVFPGAKRKIDDESEEMRNKRSRLEGSESS